MNGTEILALVGLSLRSPVQGGQAILRLNPEMGVRWTLLAAAILMGVVVGYALPVLIGAAGGLPSPMTMAGVQLGVNIAAIGLITGVGRAFGGQGDFAGALWLMGWFQVVMLVLQVVQLVIALMLPGLTFFVASITVGLFFWILTGFICALHGFRSQVLVLLGVFATLIAAAFAVTIILMTLGIEMPGMTDA